MMGPGSSLGQYRIGHRTDIEGLRAVAILLVIAAHAKITWLEGGFVGVDVFFVLSGYLITSLLVTEVVETGTVSFKNFYARRMKRLLPALLFMLAVTISSAAVLLAPFEQLNQSPAALSAALWVSNLHFAFASLDYFGPLAESNLFLHTWSLGVEEQFYLVWPVMIILMLGAWHWQGSRINIQNLRNGMLAIFSISLGLCVYLTATSPAFAFYMMPTRAWQFALGAIVYLLSIEVYSVSSSKKPLVGISQEKIKILVGWVGLFLILISALLLNTQMSYPGFLALIPSLGAAAVLFAGKYSLGFGVNRLLSQSIFQGLGRVSYSWYLWHWPVLLLGATIIEIGPLSNRIALVLLSLLLASMSYRFVELPIRMSTVLARRPGFILLISSVLMLGTVALVSLWQFNAKSWTSHSSQSRFQQVRADMPIIYADIWNCDEWYRSAKVNVCAFGSKDAKHTVVIFGDSIGLQWFPVVAKIYEKPDWKIMVITKSSCPMVDQAFFYQRIAREYVECTQWRNSTLGALSTLNPDVVILGSALGYPFSQSDWVEGTSRVLDVISKVSDETYIIRATPAISFDGPACLSRKHWQSFFLSTSNKCQESYASKQNDDVYQSLQQAAKRYDNVEVLDFNELICPNGLCSAEEQGKIVFRDTQHLTASFVESLSNRISIEFDSARAKIKENKALSESQLQ